MDPYNITTSPPLEKRVGLSTVERLVILVAVGTTIILLGLIISLSGRK